MKRTKWFDRIFDFSFEQNIFPSIIGRLEKTPVLLKNKLSEISNHQLTNKINGKWSIQENIGHLIDLEPVWQGRLEDILNNKVEMRAVDLQNKKTELAMHNDKNLDELIDKFMSIRSITTNRLYKLSDKEVYKFALHPRLKTPMRIMDLFFFVAEHDDHHASRITEIEAIYNFE